MDWLFSFPHLSDDTLRVWKKTVDAGFLAFTRTYGDAIEHLFDPLHPAGFAVDPSQSDQRENRPPARGRRRQRTTAESITCWGWRRDDTPEGGAARGPRYLQAGIALRIGDQIRQNLELEWGPTSQSVE